MGLKQDLLRGIIPESFTCDLLFPPYNDNALQVVLQAAHDGHHQRQRFIGIEFVGQLIQKSASLTHHNRLGRQPLHDAIGLGTDMISLLLESGAPVDGFKHGSWTPLMMAAHQGLSEEAAVLLRAGADCHLKNSAGFTAFHLACQADSNDRTCLLLAPHSDIHTRANNLRSALFTAIRHGNRETARLILESGREYSATEHGVTIFDNAMEGQGEGGEEARKAMLELLRKYYGGAGV